MAAKTLKGVFNDMTNKVKSYPSVPTNGAPAQPEDARLRAEMRRKSHPTKHTRGSSK